MTSAGPEGVLSQHQSAFVHHHSPSSPRVCDMKMQLLPYTPCSTVMSAHQKYHSPAGRNDPYSETTYSSRNDNSVGVSCHRTTVLSPSLPRPDGWVNHSGSQNYHGYAAYIRASWGPFLHRLQDRKRNGCSRLSHRIMNDSKRMTPRLSPMDDYKDQKKSTSCGRRGNDPPLLDPLTKRDSSLRLLVLAFRGEQEGTS